MRLKFFHIAGVLDDVFYVHIFEFLGVKFRDELIGIDSYESAFDVGINPVVLEPESQMLENFRFVDDVIFHEVSPSILDRD